MCCWTRCSVIRLSRATFPRSRAYVTVHRPMADSPTRVVFAATARTAAPGRMGTVYFPAGREPSGHRCWGAVGPSGLWSLGTTSGRLRLQLQLFLGQPLVSYNFGEGCYDDSDRARGRPRRKDRRHAAGGIVLGRLPSIGRLRTPILPSLRLQFRSPSRLRYYDFPCSPVVRGQRRYSTDPPDDGGVAFVRLKADLGWRAWHVFAIPAGEFAG